MCLPPRTLYFGERMKKTICIALLVATWCACLHAQETRSKIYGQVSDPQASSVPGAAVVITNLETNASTSLTTNEVGYYEARFLLPGNYEVAVTAAGFKKLLRRGILLPVSTQMEINLTLELGAVAESINITAEAPILDTSSASSGLVLDNRSIMDLPVLGNNVTLLVKFTPGLQALGSNRYLGLGSNSGGSEYYQAGSVGGNEYSIDGAPNAGAGRWIGYLPYSDAVQETRIETSNFDASIGHTSGVSVSMMTNAGTNSYHGALTEQHWQQRWTGTPFFVKQLYYRRIAEAEAQGNSALARQLRSEPKQPTGRSNSYATSLGGPVRIPKIYDGRNKLFFFFNFNGFKDIKTEDPGRINRTLPTLAERTGDFSQLLGVDAGRYQIYDPLTVRPDPARAGHFIRDPIPQNILPKARMVNPAYEAYLKLLPNPNNNPANPKSEPRNNYLAVATPYNWDYSAISNRWDYHHSNANRFFGSWHWSDWLEDRGDWTYETKRGLHSSGQYRANLGATLDWVYTQSASTVINVNASVNQFDYGYLVSVPLSYKPSDVGLPKYLDDKAGDEHILPRMSATGYEAISPAGVQTITHHRMITSKAEVSHVRGAHSLRSGLDVRQHFRTGGGGGNTSGNFAFTNTYTRRNDDSFTPAGDLGHTWAAFMMGLPSSMSIQQTDSFAVHNPYYAWFVQDAWRVSPKLSLSIGLRMEYEQGPTERYNRMIGYFDPAPDLPITAAAQAAYARKPVPELAASSFIVKGGTVFPGAGGASRRANRSELMWLPRAGVAYQLNSKTVLRGGYGMFYDTFNVLTRGPNQTGFSRSTSSILTTDFGSTWLIGNPRNGISPLTDPFPIRADGTRYDAPEGNALGLMSLAGRSWSYEDYDFRHARQQRWRLGLQRELSANMVIEVAYAGGYSDRVSVSQTLTALPAQFWATGQTRNDAVANNLNANVTNPFLIDNFAALRTSDPTGICRPDAASVLHQRDDSETPTAAALPADDEPHQYHDARRQDPLRSDGTQLPAALLQRVQPQFRLHLAAPEFRRLLLQRIRRRTHLASRPGWAPASRGGHRCL